MSNQYIDDSAIASLLAGNKIARPQGYNAQNLKQLGLFAEGDWVSLIPPVETLNEARLRAHFSSRALRRWPDFRVALQSRSTNAELMALGFEAVGCGLTTEFQTQGRGRRGRSWISPIGRNIAVSLCISSTGGLSGMTGLSLVAGIAVVDALRSLGLNEVALKWPNDLIIMESSNRYSKLGGILVELQQRLATGDASGRASQTLAIVGIGLNHGGAGSIAGVVDQPVADIGALQPLLRRHTVLLGVINALADYVSQWEEFGFEAMISAYNELHAFTGSEVVVRGGERVLKGTVEGVAAGGQLRLRDANNECFEVDAGEVSLRPESNFDPQ